MYSCKSYDELGKIVNAWIGGEDDEDATNNTGTYRSNNSKSNADTTGTSTTSTKAPEKTASAEDSGKKYQNLDDAFR